MKNWLERRVLTIRYGTFDEDSYSVPYMTVLLRHNLPGLNDHKKEGGRRVSILNHSLRNVVPALRGKGPRTYRRAALLLRGGISTPLSTRAVSSRGDGSLLEQDRTRDDAQVS
jgi:hypothetical protein